MAISLPAESENGFQAQVEQLAKLYGWRVAHFRPARTARGWRTPVSGDGAGWPDLILVRGRRIVAAELKGDGGKLRPEQAAWLAALAEAGVECHTWRPAAWDEIVATLAE
jgi:hypothetical protein